MQTLSYLLEFIKFFFENGRRAGAAFAAAAALAIGPMLCRGAMVEMVFAFDSPSVSINAAGMSVVAIKGCEARNVPDEPRLPFALARALLENAAEIVSVSAELLAPAVAIKLDAPLDVAGLPAAMAPAEGGAGNASGGDGGREDATAGAAPLMAELVAVLEARGKRTALIAVRPVEAARDGGSILFYPKIKVLVETSEPRGGAGGGAAAANAMMAAPAAAAGAGADYLLVTSAAFTNAFQPFVAMKEQRHGLRVMVATIEDVLASQAGRDGAEKLRNFIRGAYLSEGIQYVLLGGDTPLVPHRAAYGNCSQSGSQFVTQNIPTDLYFACLDGSWDGNGNGVWGESSDGDGGGDVDLIAEVFVGRAPVDSVAEVEIFVEKQLRYELGGHANATRALFLAEYLGPYNNGNTFSQAGRALDPLSGAFAGAEYSVAWLDDRPETRAVWTAAQALAALNQSPHIVAHDGHASAAGCMRLTSSGLAQLQNAAPFLAVSAGCDSGAFDNGAAGVPPTAGDCFAEQLVKGGPNGAFAAVMNSRYGWFEPNNEWMYSGEFMQKFFERLLARDGVSVGEAFQLSKEDLRAKVERFGIRMYYRWLYFDITLFGDPHCPLQTDAMRVSQLPASAAFSGYMGGVFSPASYQALITNTGTGALRVAVSGASFAEPNPASLTIAGGASATIIIEPSASAYALPPAAQGDAHEDAITIANIDSSYVKTIPATLAVLPNLRFAATAATVMEGGAPPPLTVTRLDSALAPITVDYAAVSGTAIAGLDFAPLAGTLHFAAGETNKTLHAALIDDEIAEPDEQFSIALFNPAGAALAAQSNFVMAVTDNDYLSGFNFARADPLRQPAAGMPFGAEITAINLTGGTFAGYAGGASLLAGAPYSYGMLSSDAEEESYSSWEYPFYAYYRNTRTEVIYTAEELGGPGLIASIELGVIRRPAIPLNNWTIRIRHTSQTSLSSFTYDTNGWTTVHTSDMSVGAHGVWRKFDFNPPFDYDGSSNIIICFSVKNNATSSVNNYGYILCAPVPTPRAFRGWHNTLDPLEWNSSAINTSHRAFTNIPLVVLEKRLKTALEPSTTGAFSNGVWRGDMALLEAQPQPGAIIYAGDPARGRGAVLEHVAASAIPSALPPPFTWLADNNLAPGDWLLDSDADGFTNWQEWKAGTDPRDDASLFKFDEAEFDPASGRVRLMWQSAPGRTYRVERASVLGGAASFAPAATGIATNEYTDIVSPSASSGFYRIVVE